MERSFYYLRQAATLLFAAGIFWLVYAIARPDAGSALGATFFAAFGAFTLTCISVAIIKIMAQAARHAWLYQTRPYLRQRFNKPPVPFNWNH